MKTFETRFSPGRSAVPQTGQFTAFPVVFLFFAGIVFSVPDLFCLKYSVLKYINAAIIIVAAIPIRRKSIIFLEV